MIADGDVLYSIITKPALADPGTPYDGLDAEDVMVTNLDNEIQITVIPTSIEVSESGRIALFTITLPHTSTSPVRIDLSSSDATEATVSPTSVTFAPGEFVKVIEVTGVDDDIPDGDVAFSIITSPAMSDDPRFNGVNPSDVAGINIDPASSGSDVSITLQADKTKVRQNELIEFTATIRNHGPADASVQFSDYNIDLGSIERFMPASCIVQGGVGLDCDLNLATDQMVVVNYSKRAFSNTPPGLWEITVTVLLSEGSDPDFSNNNATVVIEVEKAPEGEGEIDLVQVPIVRDSFHPDRVSALACKPHDKRFSGDRLEAANESAIKTVHDQSTQLIGPVMDRGIAAAHRTETRWGPIAPWMTETSSDNKEQEDLLLLLATDISESRRIYGPWRQGQTA